MKKHTQQETKTGLKRTLVGTAAAALGAAGVYYFYGSSKAAKHRKDTVLWMKNAEEEIMEEAKKLKDKTFNRENYEKIVGKVAEKYDQLKNTDSEDVREFIGNLNSAWKDLEKGIDKKVQKAKKAIK